MAKKRIKRVPLGQPLPPAPDSELTADAMREWANNEGLVHAQKYGSDTIIGIDGARVRIVDLLDATVEEPIINA